MIKRCVGCGNREVALLSNGLCCSCEIIRKKEVEKQIQQSMEDEKRFFENKQKEVDNKIKPSYYHKGDIDVIKFCIANGLDFLQGSVIKYVTRYKGKNGMEDLLKAREFLNRIIESEESK